MRSVVFLNRFYWPDVAATGQQLTDLAEDLARHGWDVTVLASRGSYNGEDARLAREETRYGVRIVRLTTTRFGRARLLGRAADSLSYMVGATARLLRVERGAVVVACSDPPFILAPALVAVRFRRFRVVYNARDLYPQLAARLGVLREDGWAYRLLAAIARRLHARCDLVVTLGARMARALVDAGAPAKRTTYVPDGADASAVHPVPPAANPFLKRHGLEGKFVVLYSGNAGRAHVFDAVLEAARRLRSDDDVVFLFIGGGKQFPALRAAAQAERLHNVRFMDYVPREQLALSLSAASVSLVTESPDVVGLLLPSKTFGILASGRPLLFIGSEQSDVAAIVRAAGCGFVVAPDDPGLLTQLILRLRGCPEEAAALGARARDAAERVYDRRIIARRWAELLGGLAHPPRRPSLSPPELPGSDSGSGSDSGKNGRARARVGVRVRVQ